MPPTATASALASTTSRMPVSPMRAARSSPRASTSPVPGRSPRAIGLRVEPVAGASVPTLRIGTDHLALGVSVRSAATRPCDSGFHLAPGTERLVRFPGCDRLPQGAVAALNSTESVRFGHDA